MITTFKLMFPVMFQEELTNSISENNHVLKIIVIYDN